MAARTHEQGRYLGGRSPYWYRLADAWPHSNKANAAWGRRARRLEPDQQTAPRPGGCSRSRRRSSHPHALQRVNSIGTIQITTGNFWPGGTAFTTHVQHT